MTTQDELRAEPAAFTAGVYESDGATVVELAGDLDLFTAGALREALLQPLLVDTAPTVRVDLSKVRFLGSTGVGLLVTACKRVRSTGGVFSVTGLEDMARQILELEGLVEYLGADS